MASLTQWTWVWVSSRRWWGTERPGVLQSMGSQRAEHDWATVQQLKPNILKTYPVKNQVFKSNLLCDCRKFIQLFWGLCSPLIKKKCRGLPWWLSGKESCQCSRQRFDPWSQKIPHAVEQWSPYTGTTELVLQSLGANYWVHVLQLLTPRVATTEACAPELVLCGNKRSHHNEKPAHRH